ncbi:type II secretion system minor pseudopilin GspK [Faucicola mancuniensis]|uniref:type II secretion system minor pseudopilin GspK n=1 Tax=Faucicola mancuniensis TaxID=1309795 RepID=UPI0028F0817D|nr:type II secretion system minor pseudopilin GspK [uncultured Moraxella sp.]
MKQSEQGVALLTILLLVVAITVVAGSMLASQKVMLREYALTQNQRQMNEYALYGEAVAKGLIQDDANVNQTDSPQDIWAKPIKAIKLNQAEIQIEIQDDSQFFNINNLYHDGAVDKQAMAYFTALLTANGIEPTVAQAVLDWQDPDSDVSGDGGAEFDYYQSLGKPLPVNIANQPLMSVDDLLFVRGMDKQKLAKIKPFLTAVPYFLPMNVNQIKPELLSAITLITDSQTDNQNQSQNQTNNSETDTNKSATQQNSTNLTLDIIALNDWASERETAVPIESINTFWQIPIFANISETQRQTMTNLLSVESRAFHVWVTVKVDDKQRFFSSQLAKVSQNQGNQNSNSMINNQNNEQNNQQILAFNRQILPFLPKK